MSVGVQSVRDFWGCVDPLQCCFSTAVTVTEASWSGLIWPVAPADTLLWNKQGSKNVFWKLLVRNENKIKLAYQQCKLILKSML